MKLDWDYTELAKTYHNRAPYSNKLILEVLKITGLTHNSSVCDMGAGTGFLAREFAAKKVPVKAIEPNVQMQKQGRKACEVWPEIEWFTAPAEDTGLADSSVDLVSFGSSFNVVDQELALVEAARICRSKGWVLIVFNHRDLTFGFQHQIESHIKQTIPTYDYGCRRKDQSAYLRKTGYFTEVHSLELPFEFVQSKIDVINAWHSHATLKRQAGELYDNVLEKITTIIQEHPNLLIKTPFITKGWLARFGGFK